jgi:ADP-ribosylglycohydrolase
VRDDAPPTERPPDRRDELARLRDRARGCLLGGALGDALGAAVEFLTLASIRATYGPRGTENLETAYGRVGAITDDTQLTLFTVEGLIRASVRGRSRGICHPPAVVRHAYRRWLHTQRAADAVAASRSPRRRRAAPKRRPAESEPELDGWLVGQAVLHHRRAPGSTCLAALEAPLDGRGRAPNLSKGCGGVMRVAPVGLLRAANGGPDGERPREGIFRLGCELAALTHGHPTGQLPAGVLAATIHGMVHEEEPLPLALDHATLILMRQPHHEETFRALAAARELASGGHPSPEKVETLGGGWVAEEALAIAIYAALVAGDDFRAALRLAANHSGDSDSTAAICGNLLGAEQGEAALPADWLAQLEVRDLATELADDLALEILELSPVPSAESGRGSAAAEAWFRKYPGA